MPNSLEVLSFLADTSSSSLVHIDYLDLYLQNILHHYLRVMVFTNTLIQKVPFIKLNGFFSILSISIYLYLTFPFFLVHIDVYFKYISVTAMESKMLQHVSVYLGKTVASLKANSKIINDFSYNNLEQ